MERNKEAKGAEQSKKPEERRRASARQSPEKLAQSASLPPPGFGVLAASGSPWGSGAPGVPTGGAGRSAGWARRAVIQAKMRVGASGDTYEDEADRVARQVMSMPILGRPDGGCAKGIEQKGGGGEVVRASPLAAGVTRLQRKMGDPSSLSREAFPSADGGGPGAFDAGADFEANMSSLRGQGSPLPDVTRAELEPKFGADFSRVNVYTGSGAAELNRKINSRAFTHGNDIYFNAGQFNPHTSAGKELLAHELTHTIQQGASPSLGRVQRSSIEGSGADPSSAPPAGPPIHVTRSPENVVQRALEFADIHKKNPALAKDIVALDRDKYESDQESFEIHLGYGLFHHEKAKSGADALLKAMKAALEAAGLDNVTVESAFGWKANDADANQDMGSVLEDDVEDALTNGNLREKMGMVYHAITTGQMALALVALRQQQQPPVKLGAELMSEEMTQSLQQQQQANKPATYAIFKRRGSVSNPQVYKRDGGSDITDDMLLNENDLDEIGLGLSEREKRAAKPDDKGKLQWVHGKHIYNLQASGVEAARKDFIRLVSGLSGSTDMYFHLAKHLKLKKDDFKNLRLAALGQMLTAEDHSYHEIMHVARTQGDLTDYPDELPIGYTKLEPLNPQQILSVAQLQGFPGDEVVKGFLDGNYDDEAGADALNDRLMDMKVSFQKLGTSTLDAEYKRAVLEENVPKAEAMKGYIAWKKNHKNDEEYPKMNELRGLWGAELALIESPHGPQNLQDFDLNTNLALDSEEEGLLTEVEKRVLYGWSRNEMYNTFQDVWFGDDEDEVHVQETQTLLSALNKLPPYKGTVFSGLANDEDVYQAIERVRKTLGTKGEKQAREQAELEAAELPKKIDTQRVTGRFESYSKRAKSSYISKQGRFLAEEVNTSSKGNGRDISLFSENMSEREVLFIPGAKFRRIGIRQRIVDYLKGGETGAAVWVSYNEY